MALEKLELFTATLTTSDNTTQTILSYVIPDGAACFVNYVVVGRNNGTVAGIIANKFAGYRASGGLLTTWGGGRF